MLLLNALALDLACVAVGTMVISGADVVERVLPLDPVKEAMNDGVDNVLEEDLEPLDPEAMLRVDDCMPPMPVVME